jgi:protein tyrosine phosphatase
MAEPKSEDDIHALLSMVGDKDILLITLTEAPNRFVAMVSESLGKKIKALHLPLSDRKRKPTNADLDWIIPIVRKAKSNNIPVIVHCKEGINRTGAMLVYLLAIVYNIEDEDEIKAMVIKDKKHSMTTFLVQIYLPEALNYKRAQQQMRTVQPVSFFQSGSSVGQSTSSSQANSSIDHPSFFQASTP